jgi:DNA-binding CsgD family transcriptional regulator
MLSSGPRGEFAPRSPLITDFGLLSAKTGASGYRQHIQALEREILRLKEMLAERTNALEEMSKVRARLHEMRLELGELEARVALPCKTGFALSPAEKRVFDVLKSSPGVTNKEIAARIGVSKRTVIFHISNIMAKMRVKSRRQL